MNIKWFAANFREMLLIMNVINDKRIKQTENLLNIQTDTRIDSVINSLYWPGTLSQRKYSPSFRVKARLTKVLNSFLQ